MTLALRHIHAVNNRIAALEKGVYSRIWEDIRMQRIRSYLSQGNEAVFATALAFLFCGAVILGFM
ncbi:hypothetical protein [Microvirga yunnanensis]|uniref:hypothetical protein n=1 Tax=Microvirga yunnanensis TaxID=2953740 RepID=UPI0021CAC089|nr:hypothetical protein [Microvirga sp. HBU65207]